MFARYTWAKTKIQQVAQSFLSNKDKDVVLPEIRNSIVRIRRMLF